MDRNLGARDTKFATEGKGTLYYQFGRKDIFPGNGVSGLETSAYKGSSGDVWTISTTDVTSIGGISISETVSNPLMLYYNKSFANWCSDVDSETYIWHDYEQDVNGNGKSIFDPSPKGWKVPASGTWGLEGEKMAFSLETMTDWNYGTEDGQHGRSYPRGDNAFAYYPSTGNRASGGAGILNNVTTQLCYWSSTPSNSIFSHLLRSDMPTVTPNNSGARTYGIGLRCVQHNE